MALSKAFVEARQPSKEEKTMLYIMALILPPCPFFVLTGPNFTCRTWEFAIAVGIQILAVVAFLVFGGFNVPWLLCQIAGFVYAFRFVHSGFERGRSLSTGYIDEEETV